MEFERALFRVHERTLLSDGCLKSQKPLLIISSFIFALCVVVLSLLHISYVNVSSCIPQVLDYQLAPLKNLSMQSSNYSVLLPQDELLRIYILDSAHAEPTAVGIAGQDSSTLLAAEQSAAFASYRFSRRLEVFALPEDIRESHSFKSYNLTVPSGCFAGTGVGRFLLQHLVGFDTIMINELLWTFGEGSIENLDSHERWVWRAESMDPFLKPDNFFLLVLWKLQILFSAVLAFFLLSTVTGLFIRITISSSAILLFPLHNCLRRWGFETPSEDLLMRSFPWIGIQVAQFNRQNKPLRPLVLAHLGVVFVFYFIYIASHFAWTILLYPWSTPEDLEDSVYAYVALVELFHLIFIRTRLSIAYLPRILGSLLIWFHVYLFSFCYGFSYLALLTTCAGSIAACMFFIVRYETVALRGNPFHPDTPSHENPRMAYMPMMSPLWTVELAPLWTAFFPVSSRETFSNGQMALIRGEPPDLESQPGSGMNDTSPLTQLTSRQPQTHHDPS